MFRRQRDISQVGRQSAQNIQRQKPPAPNHVFDAAAEEKQVEHIAKQVEKAGMNKHRGQKSVPGRIRRDQPKMLKYPDGGVASLAESEAERHQIDQHVHTHQRKRHDGRSLGLVIHSDW